MKPFDNQQIPSQKGKTVIVTGANAGIGFETALALTKKEATVILACRNLQKAESAKQKILAQVPKAQLGIIQIDLSKLDSVREFASKFLIKYSKLDILINNAGVMIPPYTKTVDGFELQLGANYLGHFLLTGLLLDIILQTPDSRIVSLSSIAHKQGKIHFDDLHFEKSYNKVSAYAQSKLACLMFAYELQRKLEKYGKSTISVAAHPGVSNTELIRHIPSWLQGVYITLFSWATHPPHEGAKPSLYASLAKEVKGGEYFGPVGFREMKGKVGKAQTTALSKNTEIAKKLWQVSEKLTGISYLT